jgi:hypothetical protein
MLSEKKSGLLFQADDGTIREITEDRQISAEWLDNEIKATEAQLEYLHKLRADYEGVTSPKATPAPAAPVAAAANPAPAAPVAPAASPVAAPAPPAQVAPAQPLPASAPVGPVPAATPSNASQLPPAAPSVLPQ